jgi:hypothetical protein
MRDIENARKLVGSAKAERPAVEAAIADCKVAMTGDEAEIATLANERKAALVAGGDKLEAHKERQAEAEERFETRRALVEALDKRRNELLEQEHVAEMAQARAGAEGLLKKAVEALGQYPAARARVLEIVEAVKQANDAARQFEQRYSDEPRIGRAEALARRTADLSEEIITEEDVERWVKVESGHLVDEREERFIVLKSGSATEGVIPSHGGGYEVKKRPFTKVTFLPARTASEPSPIVSGVELPPFLPEIARAPQVRLVPAKNGILVLASAAVGGVKALADKVTAVA